MVENMLNLPVDSSFDSNCFKYSVAIVGCLKGLSCRIFKVALAVESSRDVFDEEQFLTKGGILKNTTCMSLVMMVI